MAKVTYFLSKSDFYLRKDNEEAKKSFIYEAFGYAQESIKLDDQNADCHKWYFLYWKTPC